MAQLKQNRPPQVGMVISITPRGIRRVRVLSVVKQAVGLEFYSKLVPAIERLDRAVRSAFVQ